MSYCRWGDSSDVYVIHHVDGFLDCCGCHLTDGIGFSTTSVAEMEEHLRTHMAQGDAVPFERVMTRLRQDFPTGKTETE
jgi:hypothetical protein